MQCPYCHKEMLSGRILGDRYVLKWMPDDKELILGTWAHDSIKLLSGYMGSGMGRPYLSAYVCDQCQKIIADIPR